MKNLITKRTGFFAALIIGLIILDQYTKSLIISHDFRVGESVTVIPNLFSITYVRNPGAAFGFMAHADESIRQLLFLLIPIIACVWISWLLVRVIKDDNGNGLLGTSYALILAGAVGNLIDRFRLGYVIDFLDFYWKDAHFPAFNVADSCISVAAFFLILDFFLQLRKSNVADSN